MAKRHVVCFATKERGISEEFVKVDGHYYKSMEIYNAYISEKNNKNKFRDEVADLMGYNENGFKFPKYFGKKIAEAEPYGWDVALETLYEYRDTIIKGLVDNCIEEETLRVSYIVAIVTGNAMKNYRKKKRNEKRKELLNKQTIEPTVFDTFDEIGTNSKAKDISAWLDVED